MVRRRRLVACLLPALVGCSAASTPAEPPHRPLPIATAAPVASETRVSGLGLLDPEEAPPKSQTAVIPDSSLPVFGGRFMPVALPKKAGPILAVTGASDSDVWLLPYGGPVMRWDGKRVADLGTPQCYTDACCGTLVSCAAQPGHCRKKKNCSFGDATCVEPVAWTFLDLTASGVVAGGTQFTGGMRSSVVFARPGKGGDFACEQGKDDNVYPGSRGRGDPGHADEVTLDGVKIRFEGPAVMVNSIGGHQLTIGGRGVRLPAELSMFQARFMARSPSDLWLWEPSGTNVWHGDGLSWTPVDAGVGGVVQIWATDPGVLWILGEDLLLQRNEAAETEHLYAVPGVTRVLAGPTDFWLLREGITVGDEGPAFDEQDQAFYHWDGHSLSRAESPLVLGSAWRSPSGEVWLSGAERKAKKPEGRVFRVVMTGGKP